MMERNRTGGLGKGCMVVLATLGSLFVLLVAVFGALAAYLFPKIGEAQDFANTRVMPLVERHDVTTFWELCHPAFRKETNEEELSVFFNDLAVLGELRGWTVGGANMSLRSSINGVSGTTAFVPVEARFESGPTQIELTLMRDDEDQWLILGFHYESAGLMLPSMRQDQPLDI